MLKGVVSEPPLAASRNARDAAALLTQEGKTPACRFIHTFIAPTAPTAIHAQMNKESAFPVTFGVLMDSVYVGPHKASTFTDLYGKHAREVYRFALYLSGDPALAEDIVSETFLRIWDSSVAVRMETVRGYLFTIARNLFLHDLRRKRTLGPLEDHHLIAATTGRDLEFKEDLRRTLADLQTLPETDRTALLLRAEEGFSYEEIARILGLSLSSVKVRIHRARLKLAERRKGVVHGSH